MHCHLRSGSVIKMSAVVRHTQSLKREQRVSIQQSLIYTHSVVLYRYLLGVDPQIRPGVVSSILCTSDWLSAAFCGGELDCAVLLGDTGEEGCGVSVLSLIASSASSSLCCTEERYCSSRLQSALSAPSLPLRTGLSARTVFKESAVPLLRKLSSCAAC